VLEAIAATRPGDAALDPRALRGARIGVPRASLWGRSPHADRVGEDALRAMRELGAILVDPVELPSAEAMHGDTSEHEVLLHEFKAGVNAYLAGRQGLPVRTLAEVIRWNEAHADLELRWFGQERLVEAQARGPLTEAAYLAARQRSRALGGPRGIDAALDAHGLDVLVAPTGGPAWTIDLLLGDHGTGGSSSPAARAGYPLLSVPAGVTHGMPINVTFMGRAWSEPTLIRLAHAFEQATRAWRAPAFAPTLAEG
jgi:amidase